MLLGDGDGFVACACGHRHWGLHGAAGLLLTDPDRGVLLQRRAWWVHHGRTWALPGGAIRSTETAPEAAIREANEEAAVPEDAVHLTSTSIADHGTWSYTTVLGCTRRRVEEKAVSSESAGLRWVAPEDVERYPLHRDFAMSWPDLRAQIGRRLVLVVDAANVVGSRPDGWWRDRAGATRRLADQLAVLGRAGLPSGHRGLPAGEHWAWWPRIVLVVEGKAREVEPQGGVEVIAAERDGDAAIVEVAGEALRHRQDDHVVVVTADRELRARVAGEGAGHLGPSALLGMLEEQAR
ncbi:MAG: NUDIX domain-containing protein [Haloechinothrix sp.]